MVGGQAQLNITIKGATAYGLRPPRLSAGQHGPRHPVASAPGEHGPLGAACGGARRSGAALWERRLARIPRNGQHGHGIRDSPAEHAMVGGSRQVNITIKGAAAYGLLPPRPSASQHGPRHPVSSAPGEHGPLGAACGGARSSGAALWERRRARIPRNGEHGRVIRASPAEHAMVGVKHK